MNHRPPTDAVFAGSIPEIYDEYLVPLIFESYANDLVARLQHLAAGRVLELACGTGVVTRAMASRLPDSIEIVSSDLNRAMIDRASSVGTSRSVTWRQADALELPFADGSFDAVACQFGVMFFPDKVQAYSQALRVLRPGGVFVFNTWDRIENNEFAHAVTSAVGTMFPEDPPVFLARTPHGYHDEEIARADLSAAGFASIDWEPLEMRSTAPTASHPAIAYGWGTPLRDEIEARDASRLNEAISVATAAVAQRFGEVELDSKIRGYVVTARA